MRTGRCTHRQAQTTLRAALTTPTATAGSRGRFPSYQHVRFTVARCQSIGGIVASALVDGLAPFVHQQLISTLGIRNLHALIHYDALTDAPIAPGNDGESTPTPRRATVPKQRDFSIRHSALCLAKYRYDGIRVNKSLILWALWSGCI